MHNYNVIRSILSEPWYISASEAQNSAALVAGLLTPGVEFERITPEARAALSYSARSGGSSGGTGVNVGVVTMRGVLTKYDTLCAVGTTSYTQMVRTMSADPKIGAIVLDIDSPGGMAAGTEELAAEVMACRKPVVGFIRDMAASAAYWVVSAADVVVANNSTACVGSIGAMCTISDMRDYYAKQGIKNTEVYAPQSVDKNGDYRAALEGDMTAMQKQLSVYADKFIGAVKSNRSGVKAEQLTGATYFASEVVGSLIDAIETFDQAVARAASMAQTGNNQTKTNTNNKMKTNLTALATAAGLSALESADGYVALSEEQAAAADAAIVDANTRAANVDALTTELATTKAELKTSQGALATANQKIATLEVAAAKSAGAAPAVATPAVDASAGAQSTTADPYKGYAEAAASASDYNKFL